MNATFVHDPPSVPTVTVAGRPPHICFVTPYGYSALTGEWQASGIGGAELQQGILARSLAARGYPVSMITLDFGQPPDMTAHGVRIVRAYRDEAGLRGLRFVHPRLTTLLRCLWQVDADIYYVRSATFLLGIVTLVAAVRGRAAIYAGAHDTDFQPGREMIRFARDRWLFRFGLRHADAVVVQNPTQQALCLNNYARRTTAVRSIYGGGEGQGDPRGHVLWVATIRRWKRPERFLDMAAALPGLRFHMVGGDGGDAAYVAEIRARAARIPNLTFHGYLPYPEVEQLFDAARVFVNTSESEGFPNTFLQAWARGIPVISFFDPGFREGGQPVCRVAASSDEAVGALRAMVADDAYWQAEGERCRRYFQSHHSIDTAISAYEGLFQTVLASAGHGAAGSGPQPVR